MSEQKIPDLREDAEKTLEEQEVILETKETEPLENKGIDSNKQASTEIKDPKIVNAALEKTNGDEE